MNLPTEKHPFMEYYPEICNYLLVGSFPPIKLTNKIIDNIDSLGVNSLYNNYSNNKRNCITKDDILFYYGSRDNLFWQKLIAPIFETTIGSKEEIIEFLDIHQIGITDVCEEVSREIIKGKISSNDNHLIIHKKRNISAVIKEKNIKFIFSTSDWVTGEIESQLGKELVEIITLPSPSKMASRAIGRFPDYKKMKMDKSIDNTIDYRRFKYIELLKNKIIC